MSEELNESARRRAEARKQAESLGSLPARDVEEITAMLVEVRAGIVALQVGLADVAKKLDRCSPPAKPQPKKGSAS